MNVQEAINQSNDYLKLKKENQEYKELVKRLKKRGESDLESIRTHMREKEILKFELEKSYKKILKLYFSVAILSVLISVIAIFN